MSYAPFDHPSVWTEVGPVCIHAEPGAGYTAGTGLPWRRTAFSTP